MHIPVYQKYILFRAWKPAKTQLAENNAPNPSWLQKRSDCLRQICKRFYVKHQEMLDEDDGEETRHELEDTPLVSPSELADFSAPVGPANQVGSGQRALCDRGIQCFVEAYDITCHVESPELPGTYEKTPATLWGILQPEHNPPIHECQSQGGQLADNEVKENIASTVEESSIGGNHEVNPGKVIGEHLGDATENCRSALLCPSSKLTIVSEPMIAYPSYYSLEGDDEGYGSAITLSSPNSVSSDETRCNTPEQVVSPQTANSKLAEDAQQEDVKETFAEASLEELDASNPADEDDEPTLPPCCSKLEEGWKAFVKIVEDGQKIEIANKEDDFEGERADLLKDHEAVIEDLRTALASKIAELEQKYTKASRELREKGKEVREQRRELKAMSETMSEKERLEEDRSEALQGIRNEFKLQSEKLEEDHKRASQEIQDRYNGEMNQLRTDLQSKSEELSESAELVEEWKEIARVLQAQHHSFCNGGPACMQHIDNLKLYINQQERAWRQDWNYTQVQLQQTTVDKAVLQQELEESQEETKKAKLYISRHESKWKNAVEECRRAKQLLNADDAKAASARLLQQSADDIASLVVKNRTKAGELQRVYQLAAESRAWYDEQINAASMLIRRLDHDNGLLRTANTSLKSDVQSLQGQNQALKDGVNAFRIANSNLTNSKTTLEGQKQALEADNARLQWEKSNLQTEVNALKTQKADIQRERNTLKWNTDALHNRVSKLEAENELLRRQVDEANGFEEGAFASVESEREHPRTTGRYPQQKDRSLNETQTQVHSQDSDTTPYRREGTPFSAASALPPPINVKVDTMHPQTVAGLAQAAPQEQLATSKEDKVVSELGKCTAITDGDLRSSNPPSMADVGFVVSLAIWIILGHAVLYKVTLTAV